MAAISVSDPPDTAQPRIEPPRIELPRIELPRIELPRIELPRALLPRTLWPFALCPGGLHLGRIGNRLICLGLAGVLMMVMTAAAQAASTAGGALPWDTPIDRISDAITGPVAFMFALGGMVVLGVRWIFGGEMGAMTRSLLTTVVGICLLVLAARFVQVLFGVTGALVAG